MKWRDLNTFSKLLFVAMGALVCAYIGHELLKPGPTGNVQHPAEKPPADSLPPPPAADSAPVASESRSGDRLIESLKSPQPSVREAAMASLWKLWQGAAGPEAERRLQVGMNLIASRKNLAAVDHLTKLTADFPGYAEAYNQRAIAYFQMEEYERSIQDCLKSTELNRDHFGAWSGLGQCYLALRRFDLALSAFERVLDLQPFSEDARRFIELCRERMKNTVPPDLSNSA